jgi:hypothetical protein
LIVMLLLFSTAPPGRLVDGYVLFLGALLLFGLVQAMRVAADSEQRSAFDEARRPRRRPPERPRELAKLEREVVLASTSAFDLHFRLRPLLRDVAAHRLAARLGLELDSGSTPVRAALGNELWELVRPDRPPPRDRLGPGLPAARLRAALDVLERI